MIRRGLKSCLVGQIVGLFACLHVKVSLHSVFKPLNFESSMSCIVIDNELADKNAIKDLAVFVDGMFLRYSFCLPKRYKPTKQAF